MTPINNSERSLGRDGAPSSEHTEVRTDGQRGRRAAADDVRPVVHVAGDGEGRRDLERYHTTVETVSDMIYTLDAAGTLTYVNRVFAGYFGYTRERAIGTEVAEVLPEPTYEASQELI